MIEKITEEELDFVEVLYNPVALSECLFSDVDNLALFNNKFSHLRLGQFPLLSFEYLLGEDPNLSEKENFKLREGAGNLWCLGGRRFGKTLVVEILDTLISMVLLEAETVGFTSLDHLHIRGVLEKVITGLENHPFLRMFKPKINRSPTYRIYLTKSGYVLEGVNMNITGKNPGAQFFQKHFTRMVEEEASFETEEVYSKRLDSVSENGCVMRFAGMTNFTKHSPIGRTFYDLSKRPWVLNLPQYINPKWDRKEKEKAIKEHGGENSIGYRVFVKGEVVEEGISVFDMERVRKCYDEKQIKHIEITKDTFSIFNHSLVVERPKNADVIYVCADIGESAPTEIVIVAKVGDIYKYLYDITLYNLTHKQQYEVFKFIAEEVKANFIGLDTTEGTGRAIFRMLEEKFSRDHLVWCAFNEKIPVDFDKDDNGNTLFQNGKPVMKEEFVSEWSIKRLKDLFYDKKMDCPLDYKLDIQFNSVISMQSGNRTVYKCISEEDHLLSAFRVFGIAEWYNEFNLIKPISTKSFGKVGV